MNLAQRLSHYTHQLRYSDLPSVVIRESKKRIIDSLGVGISAFHSRPGKIARKIAETGTGISTVLGTRLKTSAPLAGFANGSLIRYWDYNDTYLSKEPAHPSDNLGALLAVAEAEKKSGKDLIASLVLAYEIQCRLCDAASLRVRGWDHVTYGAFSVALGAGKLMNLSQRELEHALGLSGIASIALRQTRVGEISDWKAPAFANAARNAVFSCELARLGMTGPAPIFEGEKGFERLVSGPIRLAKLGGEKIPFKLLETYIKFYPVEYHAQAAVEAALRLRPRIRNIHKIKKIEVDTYEVAIEIIVKDPEKWEPKSRETADHSLPFVVARSLLDGKLTLAQYTNQKIHDPKVLALMRKMRVTEDKKMTRQYPALLPCRIRMVENGGDVLEELVEIPRGHYKNPMTEDEINQKFIHLTAPYFSKAQQDRVLDQIWHLEKLNRWESLMNSLVVSP
ncbi:MAG: MmgE/PrpD family protein [Candidatus Omnitrophica bacterium]|nr:MmgE/PrpD family protein [Candidatus Omnitrophota bacterium]